MRHFAFETHSLSTAHVVCWQFNTFIIVTQETKHSVWAWFIFIFTFALLWFELNSNVSMLKLTMSTYIIFINTEHWKHYVTLLLTDKKTDPLWRQHVKGIVHQKMKTQSLSTHAHADGDLDAGVSQEKRCWNNPPNNCSEGWLGFRDRKKYNIKL